MSVLAQLNAGLATITQAAQAALVTIHNGRGHGAGTIWQADGLIITNDHVVGRSHRLRVILPDGTPVEARLIGRSPTYDLAALVVEAHSLPTIPIGDSRELAPGDWVTAVGHPWGVHGGATGGVVVSTHDTLPEIRSQHNDWLAMSLHLRPGHSGGAVVNSHGALVGVNTMMAGPEVGIAVPSAAAVAFIKATINGLQPPRPRPHPQTV